MSGPSESMYMEHILDLYKHPHNFGTISTPTFHHKETNPLCGDEVEMFVILKNNLVQDVKFGGHGCAICMACASMLTDEVKGKTAEHILKMGNEDIYRMLGIHLSPSRVKCALLPLFTIRNGLFFHTHNTRDI